jgi:hypothetical protein
MRARVRRRAGRMALSSRDAARFTTVLSDDALDSPFERRRRVRTRRRGRQDGRSLGREGFLRHRSVGRDALLDRHPQTTEHYRDDASSGPSAQDLLALSHLSSCLMC